MPEQQETKSGYDFFPDRRPIFNKTLDQLAQTAIEHTPPHEYAELITKYLRQIPNVCDPCTDNRITQFQKAPLVWAIRYPAPADVIAELDETMPCTHIQGNEDIIGRISARVATQREVTLQLP